MKTNLQEFSAAAQRDLASELAEMCGTRPQWVLHGRKSSFLTFAAALADTVARLKAVARHDVPLLLTGERGCGKSYLAQVIHELSPRYTRPMWKFSCSSTCPDQFERELFGQRPQRRSAGDHAAQGRIEMAQDGTLLLQDIDSLPIDLQGKLLLAIEAGHRASVDDRAQDRQPRFLLTAGCALETLLVAGTFRGDLHDALSSVTFHLPSLRERPSDIAFLTRKFALHYSRKFDRPLRAIDPALLAMLRNHDWPGNIRELKNLVRSAVLYSRGDVLTADALPDGLPATPSATCAGAISQTATLEERVEHVERSIIADALRRNGFHRQATARELGVSRVTLYNKMKKFGMMS